MTINELIGEAERFATYAVREADRDRIDHERIMRYTAVAQACAMTAGAMVQHAWWKERQANAERDELRHAIASEWRQATHNEYDADEQDRVFAEQYWPEAD